MKIYNINEYCYLIFLIKIKYFNELKIFFNEF